MRKENLCQQVLFSDRRNIMEFDLSKKHCYYFNEISKIPRGSGNEKAVSDYIVAFAKERRLACKQDDLFNVIIDKPATPGYEDSEPLILQAHIDMVCEKNGDSDHDFEKDPLELYVDDEGWLHAKGTTLGADDGNGVAYMMAILDDNTLVHPALSCIFTAQEEVGLVGAAHLTKEDLHGKRLINLDGGGGTVTCTSSAGGCRLRIYRFFKRVVSDGTGYHMLVKGLKGGHSGGSIHLERGNANLIAARLLKELEAEGIDVTLSAFNGGLKNNAIPREADVLFDSPSSEEIVIATVQNLAEKIRKELEFSDEGFTVEIEKMEVTTCIDKESSDAFLNYLFLMPNGLMHRSMAIEGLTTASLNAGVVHTKEDHFMLDELVRSALESDTDLLVAKLKTLADLLGMEVQERERYGGWAYSAKSPLRDTLAEVVKAHGKELVCKATHGGLECGIFKALDPDMDIITYGPVSTGEHTPDEKLNLESFDESYQILCDVIKASC